jgi:hypothetical protein
VYGPIARKSTGVRSEVNGQIEAEIVDRKVYTGHDGYIIVKYNIYRKPSKNAGPVLFCYNYL